MKVSGRHKVPRLRASVRFALRRTSLGMTLKVPERHKVPRLRALVRFALQRTSLGMTVSSRMLGWCRFGGCFLEPVFDGFLIWGRGSVSYGERVIFFLLVVVEHRPNSHDRFVLEGAQPIDTLLAGYRTVLA